jgi:23S rRNA (cytosine1962-C5)-methyltransferase
MMQGKGGQTTAGEIVLQEKSAGRILSTAVFARWSNSD